MTNIPALLTPDTAGGTAGAIAALMFTLLLALALLLEARKPDALAKSFIGMALVSGSWAFFSAVGLLGDELPGAFAPIFGLLGFGGLTIGLFLAGWGLIEVRRQPAPRQRGTVPSAFACGCGLLMAGVFIVAVVGGFQRGREKRAAGESAPAVEQRLDRPEFNFTLEHPGAGWTALDPTRVNAEACVVLRHRKPDAAFLVIAEDVGASAWIDAETLAEVAWSNFNGAARDAERISETPRRVAGMDGLELMMVGNTSGTQTQMRSFVTVHAGFAYQLILSCPSESGDCAGLAEEVWAGFRLIDADRVPEALRPAGDLADERLGIELQGLEDDWAEWPELQGDVPGALFGAVSEPVRAFVVFAHELRGENPPHATLASGLLGLLDFDLDERDLKEVELPTVANAQSIGAWTAHRSLEDSDYFYLLHALRAGDRAILLASWSTLESQSDLAALNDPLLGFGVGDFEASGEPVLDDAQRRSRAEFYGGLAAASQAARQHGDGVTWREHARELAPDDSSLAVGHVAALHWASRSEDALRLVNETTEVFPDDLILASWKPFLLHELNQAESAIEAWEVIFERGYRDEEDFLAYLRALRSTDRFEEALAALTASAGERPSLDLTRLQAGLLGDLARHPEAIELLEGLQRSGSLQPRVSWALVRAFDQADRHSQQLAEIERLIENGHASADAWHWKADAEQGLGWNAKAKASLERALELQPGDPDLLSFLEVVSAELGEGNNSSVKAPIDPVALPEVLSKGLPPEPNGLAGDGSLAWLHQSSMALAWSPGEPLRRTRRLKVRILDSLGVDHFSTLRFPFDPLLERIHVNEVRVVGLDGELLGEADRSASYVLDEPSDQASHDKLLHVPVPGLRPGSDLSYVVTREDLSPSEDLRYLESYLAGARDARRRIVYFAGDATKLQITTRGDLTVREFASGRAWLLDGCEATPSEPFGSAWGEFAPFVRFMSSGSSWSEEAASYLGDISDRLAPEESVTSLAKRLTRGVADREQRIQKLARHVQESCSYTAIEFGRRGRIPNPASRVLENRYGDCKDHALLLHQLLRAVGITAHLALVSTGGRIDDEHPSLDQFNHLIVHVPDSAAPFLDATDKHVSLAIDIPLGLGARQALVLDPESPRLVEIPAPAASLSTLRLARTMQVDEAGALEVSETVTAEGYLASGLRRWLAARTPDERLQGLQSWLGSGTGLEISEVEVANVSELDELLQLKLEYRLRDWAASAGGQRVGRLPAPWERVYLLARPVRERRTPFIIHQPFTIRTQARFRGGSLSGGGFEALGSRDDLIERSVSIERDGSDLVVSSLVVQRGGSHPAERYDDFVSQQDEVLRALEAHVIVAR